MVSVEALIGRRWLDGAILLFDLGFIGIFSYLLTDIDTNSLVDLE